MVWETYEISLWTHDDKFISILAQSSKYYAREAFNPIFKINTNGEINLSFTIPIIIFNKETNTWEDNTLWYNTLKNNHSLSNEQKVKLIFDKNKKNSDGTYAHTIYETVITNLIERRDGHKLYCDVQCVGYAFKWLGKTGYNITLDSDTVLLDEEENNTTIYPTINYWLDKIFPKNDDGTWATSWGYKIQMNYAGIGNNRDSSKIYEDDDIINWIEKDDGTLKPLYNSEPIEKQRFPTISESNKYNITQDLAELFEVFIRYDFLYEDTNNPFKITRGLVVFYNEIPEYTEYAITYQDNEVGLSKTSDSNDIITKLYVPEIESEYSDNGYITIADAPNNITKDNFILNFDYFIQSGQLSYKQQNAIPQYQKDIRSINTRIEQTISTRNSIEDSIVDNEIIINTISSKIEAAQSNINDYNDKLSTIDSNLTSHILTDNKVAYIVSENNNKLLVTFKRGGVIESSIISETENVTFIIHSKDNYGYIKSVEVSGTNKGNIVYFTYQYDLLSYYRNEIETYTSIKDSLIQQYEEKNNYLGNPDTKVSKQDGTLYEQYNYYEAQYKSQVKEKEKITLDFENLMGYFLKEGNWNTTNYEAPAESKQLNNCTMIYDETPLEGEQLSYYLVGVSETKTYYNYIDITSIQTSIPNIEELVIIDKWKNNNIDYTKQYLYNAQYTPQFMKINDSIHFILLLDNNTNIDTTTHSLYYIKNNEEIEITSLYRSGEVNKNNLVYRRYIINDNNIITNSIKITNGGNELDEYYDYTISSNNTARVITFKCNNKVLPNYSNFNILYKCDRSTSQFFYDAQDVAATSAFPTTSYEVNFIYLQQKLNITPKVAIDNKYKAISKKLNDEIDLRLGSIVRINDHQLNFYGVKGIVSEISLDLERNQNNSFTIQNYKTRFEDLFGRIVASSEQMKANSISYNRAASAILPTQQIVGDILQNTINSNSLIFNSGYTSGVTFSDEGILVENTYPYMNGVTGQVILKGGGIFLSDSVDADGNRIFHTGITPAGINASVITTGRLDTEKINIYSGNQVRFTWNSEGLVAYAQDDAGTTLYNTYVKYNENGLTFNDNGFEAVKLGWSGLYLGAQDGSIELTNNEGLVVYNGNIDKADRIALIKLGRFGSPSNYEYGMRLYDINGEETLITSNAGELWLKKSLAVGRGDGIVGITGEGTATDSYSPIRIWAGSTNKGDAPFWVKEDGSIRAENAYIKGEIHAISGEFSGTISANDGTIGGWTINSDSISSGGIVLSPATYNESGEIITQASITVGDIDKEHTIISGDGTLTASGANITGEIHATSGEFKGTITATGGKIGNLTIQSIENMSDTVSAIEGDKSIFRVEVDSSNGNLTYYDKQFTTVLTANAYIGNIPLTAAEYDNYNFQWEKSVDGNTWDVINGQTARSWNYQNTFTEQQYIRCIMTKKS